MRNNLPITTTEYPIGENTLIVSKTDLKGKLTYFNDEFVKASGFEAHELLGQPHNIIRHPDMPPVAFEDLWRTLQAGKPWSGAVKNRRKNGDFYWVLASATPVWEAGIVTGYMSIRSKLPASHRDEAARIYKLIRNGEGGRYRLQAGIIRKRGWADLFAPFTRTLRARIVTLLASMAASLLMISGIGLLTLDGAADSFIQKGAVLALDLIALLLGGLIGLSTMKAIGQPIRQLNEVMDTIAQGKFNTRITVDRDDELGIALRNLQALQAKLGFEQEQKRDTAQRTAAQRKTEMQRLAGEFEAAVGAIVGAVSGAATELEESATTMTRAADTTLRLSESVALGSEEASTNVQSVAASTEEMSSSVGEIGRQVQESTRIAAGAVQQVVLANARIEKLSEAAGRIGDVAEMISAIASQTNLLALNATIEAARAGEAGRGFAVVASEVKGLAEQTAKATTEIARQISEIQGATENAVDAIKEIGGTMGQVSQITTAIAAAVEEQGVATQEIARSVQQAAEGTAEVSANVSKVSRSTIETGSASSQVLGAAQSLSVQSRRLQDELDKFLASLRAA